MILIKYKLNINTNFPKILKKITIVKKKKKKLNRIFISDKKIYNKN